MKFDIEYEKVMFEEYTLRMRDTFAKKRADYGQTTTETFAKFGPIAMLVRMHDKIGRLDNLLTGKTPDVVDERVEDTLLDLANYALITLIELAKINTKGDDDGGTKTMD